MAKEDPFYPKDAREKNFADARETATRNHEVDVQNREVGSNAPSEIVESRAVEVVNPVADVRGAQKVSTDNGTTTVEVDPKQSQTKAKDASTGNVSA
jgi:hypothetical protein